MDLKRALQLICLIFALPAVAAAQEQSNSLRRPRLRFLALLLYGRHRGWDF